MALHDGERLEYARSVTGPRVIQDFRVITAMYERHTEESKGFPGIRDALNYYDQLTRKYEVLELVSNLSCMGATVSKTVLNFIAAPPPGIFSENSYGKACRYFQEHETDYWPVTVYSLLRFYEVIRRKWIKHDNRCKELIIKSAA